MYKFIFQRHNQRFATPACTYMRFSCVPRLEMEIYDCWLRHQEHELAFFYSTLRNHRFKEIASWHIWCHFPEIVLFENRPPFVIHCIGIKGLTFYSHIHSIRCSQFAGAIFVAPSSFLGMISWFRAVTTASAAHGLSHCSFFDAEPGELLFDPEADEIYQI